LCRSVCRALDIFNPLKKIFRESFESRADKAVVVVFIYSMAIFFKNKRSFFLFWERGHHREKRMLSVMAPSSSEKRKQKKGKKIPY
jgi:hypothetical protein